LRLSSAWFIDERPWMLRAAGLRVELAAGGAVGTGVGALAAPFAGGHLAGEAADSTEVAWSVE
jgi:hypothetical protein